MKHFQPTISTPKVKDGRVQRKNRRAHVPRYDPAPQGGPIIYRERPGEGCRHLLLKRDMERFLEILPDWDELSRGLHAIVLATHEPNTAGWHSPGIVAVCAWSRSLHVEMVTPFVEEHAAIFDWLGVEREPLSEEWEPGFLCKFTEASARAFQLLHILLHELGHHHDRMTTRSQRKASRGENFAERYAIHHAERIQERYLEVFGW
jgi:hypothetical protein